MRRLCLQDGGPEDQEQDLSGKRDEFVPLPERRARTAAGTTALLSQRRVFRRSLLAAPFLFMDEKNDNSGEEQEKEVISIQAVADDNAKRMGEAVEAAFVQGLQFEDPGVQALGRQRTL